MAGGPRQDRHRRRWIASALPWIAIAAACSATESGVTVVRSTAWPPYSPIDVSAPDPPSGYDGFGDVIRLADGSFLASGFDDLAEPRNFERAALWQSRDLGRWERVGASIGAGTGQQAITALAATDEAVVAVVADYGIASSTTGAAGEMADASAEIWEADADGSNWRQVDLPHQPSTTLLTDVAVVDGTFVVSGSRSYVTLVQPVVVVRDRSGAWNSTDLPGRGTVWSVVENDGAWWAFGGLCTEERELGNAFDWGCGLTFPDMSAGDEPWDAVAWRSTDDGRSWSVVDVGLPADPELFEYVSDAVSTPAGVVLVVSTLSAPDVGERVWRLSGDRLEPIETAPLDALSNGWWVEDLAVDALGQVALVRRTYDDTAQNSPSVLDLIDPVTLEATRIDFDDPATIDQVEAAIFDSGRLVVLGRRAGPVRPDSDLAVAEVPLAD